MIARIKDNILLYSILVGALFVRVWGLWNYHFNGDEMEHLIIASGSSLADVFRRKLTELHPPLVDIVHHYQLLFTSDMFLLRLSSVLAGVIAVAGFYQLGNVLQGRTLGLFCAFYNAFAPLAVVTSSTFRNYALFMALVSWALYCFFCYQQTDKKKYLTWFAVLIFLASATHFSGFLVAGICGISQAIVLLRAKKWHPLIIFSASFLPLCILAIISYFYYFAPDTSAPLWKGMGEDAGLIPRDLSGRLTYTIFGIVISFFPIINFLNGWWWDTPGFHEVLIAVGMLCIALYIVGMKVIYERNRDLFWFLVVAWIVAFIMSVSGFYPVSITRHNYYFAPFFILPFGYLFENTVGKFTHPHFIAGAIIGMALLLGVAESYFKEDGEFSLRSSDFEDAQHYLKARLQKDDVIVAGHEAAYLYLLYDKDKGATPYNAYAKFSYVNGSLVITNPPFTVVDRQYFYRMLKEYAQKQYAANPHAQVWFVAYGWKNPDIWQIVNCSILHKKNSLSRDGVLIFSVPIAEVQALANNKAAWDSCHPETKLDIGAVAFKKVPDL